MVQVFDAIVVGGGPGGSNAAAAILRHGLSVAQIEKFKFPRTKPCAGAVTIKACSSLLRDLQPALRSEFREFEFNVWGVRSNRFSHKPSELLKMVHRPEFDNWMVTENLKSEKFSFFDGQAVTGIRYSDGVFSVSTGTHVFQSKYLVGADGAYSVVNRIFKIAEPKGFALAAEVTLARSVAMRGEDKPPCWDFGAIPYGYGWVFPKNDHWSVGLYTLRGVKDIRERLIAYIEEKGFRVDDDPLRTFESHLFPYGGYRLKVPQAPVYVVGDAGGFGDAITGEGIYHALESGRIAGEAIVEAMRSKKGHYQRYRSKLRKAVLADTFLTYQISKEFYRNVDKAMTLLENPLVWRPFVQGYADGATFSACIKKGGWFLAKSFSRLGHARIGRSLPLSLRGGLRGIPFLAEPLLKRVQRYVGLAK